MEEFAAARITTLMGQGQSRDAAFEMYTQIQQLQMQGPQGMMAAQELLRDTRADFNAAGFGRNLQDAFVTDRMGQIVGDNVFMMTDQGPMQVASLQYQRGFQPGCDSFGYGLAGIGLGRFGMGRWGGSDLNLRIGNFDLNIFGGGGGYGYGGIPGGFYAPQAGWANSFYGSQYGSGFNLNVVADSFRQYPAGARQTYNQTTVENITNNYVTNTGKTVNMGGRTYAPTNVGNQVISHGPGTASINGGTIYRAPTAGNGVITQPSTLGNGAINTPYRLPRAQAPVPNETATYPGANARPNRAVPQVHQTPPPQEQRHDNKQKR